MTSQTGSNTQQSWTICLIGVLLLANAFQKGEYNLKPLMVSALGSAIIKVSLLLGSFTAIGFAGSSQLHFDLMVGALILPLVMLLLRYAAMMGLNVLGEALVPVLIVGRPIGLQWSQQMLTMGKAQEYLLVGQVNIEHLDIDAGVDWQSLAGRYGAIRLLVVVNEREQAESALLSSLLRGRMPFVIVRPEVELPMIGTEAVAGIGGGGAVAYRSQITEPQSRLTKAVFDVVVAFVLTILTLPMMLVIGALIRLDGSPVLFAHERIGADGRLFKCLKFRSMVRDPERVLDQVLATDPVARQEWAERQKLAVDPRVTRIGRFLRASSLDELPQLLNVLRLEMSLVGPRPIVENEVGRYGADIEYYFKARPGLTGLWQVSGRSDTTYEQRIELDRLYVKNWCLSKDIMIILRTFPAVFSQRGAR